MYSVFVHITMHTDTQIYLYKQINLNTYYL